MNTCNFCNKCFSSLSNLIRHKKTCKIKKDYDNETQKNKELLEEKDREKKREKEREKDRIIEQKDEEIAFLKTLLEVCVKKPIIQNTQNNIQNISTNHLIVQLEPINFGEIKDNLHNFDNYKQRCGLEGFAEFLCQDIFNGKILLTDHSRDIFRYNTIQKKDVRDPKGTFLLNESIRQVPNELLTKFETTKEILEENDMSEEKINKTTIAIKLIRKNQEHISVQDPDFANVIRTNAIDNMNQKLFLQE
jgi:hypothetical protein